eukprot:jgi/Tetstr1/462229/TSEL_000628.t1
MVPPRRSGKADDGKVPAEFEELVKPHVASYDYFLGEGLQTLVMSVKPVTIEHSVTKVKHRVWFENPSVGKPLREAHAEMLEPRLFPRDCREMGTTYKAGMHVDFCFQAEGQQAMRFSKRLGMIPIMVKSSACHLRHMNRAQLVAHKEEATEFGGYFVCNGIERIIRCLINNRRHYIMALRRSAYLKRGANYTNVATMLRCVRPDQSSATVRCHLLKDGTVNFAFTVNRAEYFIPLGILLKCFLEVTDHEVYEKIMSSAPLDDDGPGQAAKAGGHFSFVAERVELLLRSSSDMGLRTRAQCLAYLGSHFRVMLRSEDYVDDIEVGLQLLEEFVFIHLEQPLDKFNLLLQMLHKLYALANGKCCEDNPDANTFHEILLPGHLLCKFMKEKLEDCLARFSAQVRRELTDKPESVELLSELYMRRVAERTMLDVGQMMEYMLSTGNLVSRSGLDLSQASGFTVVAEKLNFFRYLSHFRSVHRGAYFMELRTTTVRKLLPESWGFLCPVHTPDGGPCGLLNHFTHCCRIVTHSPPDAEELAVALVRVLSALGMLPVAPGLVPPAMPRYLPVMLDGRVVGYVAGGAMAERLVARLRDIKAATLAQLEGRSEAFPPTHRGSVLTELSEDEAMLPYHTEVVHIPALLGGVFPGIHVYTEPARMARPIRDIRTKAVQYVGSLEQLHMDIRCPDGGEGGSGGLAFSHEELDTGTMLSVVASLTPYCDFNQSPRNMYQCQMGKQTMGTPAQALPHRTDTKLYRLQTPQTPIARTEKYDKFHMDEFPSGTNAVVAVLAYTGYDMEDAMIINKSSMERGFGHGTLHKTEVVDLKEDKSAQMVFAAEPLKRGEQVAVKSYEGAFGATLPRNVPSIQGESTAAEEGRVEPAGDYKDADHLDVDGLPHVGALIWPGETTHCTRDVVTSRYRAKKLKGEEIAHVESVTVVGQGPGELQRANIKYRFNRNPVIGDKFSSRHGQKGVLSQLWPDIDMPFCETTGMRPDVIINPHAFPSRMTIGMLVESMAAKAGALDGEFVDATAFQTSDGKPGDPITYFGDKLEAAGYSRLGGETMISGITGEEFPVDIFIGTVYYQRLRHMVSDKFQVRSTGPINPLTRQPVKGRKLGGGIRLGEMERDSLLAHGAAYLLHDRLHTCSDYCIVHVCTQCRSVLSPVSQPPAATVIGRQSGPHAAKPVTVCRLHGSSKNVEQVAMPFVFKYLIAELAAMNIKVQLDVK